MNEKMSRLESQIENGKYKGDDINRLEAEYNSEKGAHLDRENEKRFQKQKHELDEWLKTAKMKSKEDKGVNKPSERER